MHGLMNVKNYPYNLARSHCAPYCDFRVVLRTSWKLFTFMCNVNHVKSEKAHSHFLFLSSTESVFGSCSAALYNV